MTTIEQKRRVAEGSAYRVIEIHGECGLPDVEELGSALGGSAPAEAGVVIGLEHCEFIDSMALAALVRERDRIEGAGGRLVMAAPTGQVRRVLRVSRLDTDGLVFDSVEEAIAGPAY